MAQFESGFEAAGPVMPETQPPPSNANNIVSIIDTATNALDAFAKHDAKTKLDAQIKEIEFVRKKGELKREAGNLAALRLNAIRNTLGEDFDPSVETEMQRLSKEIDDADIATKQGSWRPDFAEARKKRAISAAINRAPKYAAELKAIGGVGGGSMVDGDTKGQQAVLKSLDELYGVGNWGTLEEKKFHQDAIQKARLDSNTSRISLNTQNIDEAVQDYGDILRQNVAQGFDDINFRAGRLIAKQGALTRQQIDELRIQSDSLAIRLKSQLNKDFAQYGGVGKTKEHLAQLNQTLDDEVASYTKLFTGDEFLLGKRLEAMNNARNQMILNNAPPMFHLIAGVAGATSDDSKILLMSEFTSMPAQVLNELRDKLTAQGVILGQSALDIRTTLSEYYAKILTSNLVPPGYENLAAFAKLQSLNRNPTGPDASADADAVSMNAVIAPDKAFSLDERMDILLQPAVVANVDRNKDNDNFINGFNSVVTRQLQKVNTNLGNTGHTVIVEGGLLKVVPRNISEDPTATQDPTENPLFIQGTEIREAPRDLTRQVDKANSLLSKYKGIVNPNELESIVTNIFPQRIEREPIKRQLGKPEWNSLLTMSEAMGVKEIAEFQRIKKWDDKIDYLARQDMNPRTITSILFEEGITEADMASVINNVILRKRKIEAENEESPKKLRRLDPGVYDMDGELIEITE